MDAPYIHKLDNNGRSIHVIGKRVRRISTGPNLLRQEVSCTVDDISCLCGYDMGIERIK